MSLRQVTSTKNNQNGVSDHNSAESIPGEEEESHPKQKTENEKGEKSGADADDRGSTMFKLFGFELDDFSSWDKFVCLLNRPADPSSLALLRILFGVLMALDVMQERGLANADFLWGDQEECHFPLFDFLQPLPLAWMYVVYLLILLGSLGILFGAFYRLSCGVFVVCYWYVYLLAKTRWNNHSYLFGLCGILLMITDGHHAWSFDSLFRPDLKHSHVPLWNYTLFRTQFFLVYFLAGIKKLDADWVWGYSMKQLSTHWVFSPFLLVLTPDQVDLLIVHHGGLLIDLFIGYALFFDVSRPYAMVIGTMFHFMNSQLFSIGMFPWTMMATTPIFCSTAWPKTLFEIKTVAKKHVHCLYRKSDVKPDDDKVVDDKKDSSAEIKTEAPQKMIRSSPGRRHHTAAVFCMLYLSTQCFLPFSHSITKGYNNWTNGLYGYSWDMMIHTWSTQHVRITYYDRDTNKTGYLNPTAWSSGRSRWTGHADMVVQYAHCIKDRLAMYNLTNIELYFDVWRSMNDRFQQRMFDPNVNILEADWSPFRETTWVKPLLTELSNWREKLDEIERGVYEASNVTDVTFIADFPGLVLENYIQPDLNDTRISVLSGEIEIELVQDGSVTHLKTGEETTVPAGEYHMIKTVSEIPSCLMYLYRNTTEEELTAQVTLYEQSMLRNETDPTTNGSEHVDEKVINAHKLITSKREEISKASNVTHLEKVVRFWKNKYLTFSRGFKMTYVALVSIVTQQPFEVAFNTTLGPEFDMMEEWED